MNYIVKPLSPDMALTFTEYLENLSFDHAPHWATCFCRYYHSNCSFDEWKDRTGEENRTEAVEQIKKGSMKGYLAFDGEKCIGWCNANDVREFKRLEDDLSHIVKDQKIGCVICFVIHPEYRRQGVARLLLKEAVEGFKTQGFDGVLSIPVDISDDPEKLYRGTMNMYREYGFEEIEKKDNSSMMFLRLQA
jgi:ribosomal protein S18 acetylase RimI-like enzyme